MSIIIREIEEKDKEQMIEMYEEYIHSKLIPGIDRFEGIRNLKHLENTEFEDWLKKLELNKTDKELPKNYSTSTTYIAINEKQEIVGAIGLRWQEVGCLTTFGGLIGYSIRPSKRGQGYGSEMLKLALQEYKNQQPLKEKILITCKDFNIPSKRVIEKNGGEFESIYYNEDDKYTYLRYWIQL